MKKFGKILALTLCAAFAFAGCTPAAPSVQTPSETPSQDSVSTEQKQELEGNLLFWSMWNETEAQGEVFKQIVDEFVAKNPKVKIEVQWCGRDINKILKPALDGGQIIDIFDYPLKNQLDEHVLDLTDSVLKEYPTTDGKTLADTLLPMMLETPKAQTGVSDKLLAVGYKPYMSLFMYNANMFDKLNITAPTTWEELDKACATIKASGVSPITFDDAYAVWLPGVYLAREKGQDYVKQLTLDTTGEMWKDEAVVKMAKAFEDFAKKGYFDVNVGGNKWPAGQVDVANEKAAMYLNLTGLPTEVKDITNADFKWGGFNFPDTVAGQTQHVNVGIAGSGMISIGKATKNPELATEFLAFILSKESDKKMADIAGMIPSLRDSEWSSNLAGIKGSFDSIDTIMKVGGDIESNPDLTPSIAENFIKLAAGQINADKFVANMVAAAKK